MADCALHDARSDRPDSLPETEVGEQSDRLPSTVRNCSRWELNDDDDGELGGLCGGRRWVKEHHLWHLQGLLRHIIPCYGIICSVRGYSGHV